MCYHVVVLLWIKNTNKKLSFGFSQIQIKITEIREQFQAVYGQHPLWNTAVKKGVVWFRTGWDSIEDDECEGRSCSTCSAYSVQKVKQTVEMNDKVTTRKIAECTGINWETFRLILHEELVNKKNLSGCGTKSLFTWPKTNASGTAWVLVSCGYWKWNFESRCDWWWKLYLWSLEQVPVSGVNPAQRRCTCSNWRWRLSSLHSSTAVDWLWWNECQLLDRL